MAEERTLKEFVDAYATAGMSEEDRLVVMHVLEKNGVKVCSNLNRVAGMGQQHVVAGTAWPGLHGVQRLGNAGKVCGSMQGFSEEAVEAIQETV